MIFAIALIAFFISPIIMNRIRVPGIIGPILAGVLLGPNGLHVLDRGETVQLLGTVGLLFIIFIAGLELDLNGFKQYRQRSITFGLFSFLTPFLVGMFLSVLLGYDWWAAVLLGSIVGSHTLLSYPIASRLGIAKNGAITTTIGGTLVTDTLAMVVLAVVAGAAVGDLSMIFWVKLIASAVILVLAVLVGAPILSKWFFRNSNGDGVTEFLYVMVVLFVSAFLAKIGGLEPIIGAFLAGLALNRYIADEGIIMNRVRFTANSLFIPFFLFSVGMLMDIIGFLQDPNSWIVTAGILVSVIGGKYVATIIGAKIFGYTGDEQRIMFGLSINQAAATLAATLVGFDLGLLDQATVNGVIIMILVTCMIGPYMTEKYGRRLASSVTQEEQNEPERILIPLANPETMESLLELSFMVRNAKKTSEPLFPLTVVQKEVQTAHTQVASAEKMLNKAISYSTSAEVPVRPVTKVDLNIVKGIERAMTEERITTLVMGWNGKRSGAQMLFGNVIDQALDHTYQRMIVSKLGHPLQTTDRVAVVIPNHANQKPGFMDSLAIIKNMVAQLGAELEIHVIGPEKEIYEKIVGAVKPSLSMKIIGHPTWKSLEEYVEEKLLPNDLVILLSARKGTIAWHPKLEELPTRLAQSVPKSFVIFYPTEQKEVDMRGTRGTSLSREWMFNKDYEE
ncbi:cation:proton antiporter [Mangrovibacillus cuniculi]|uniref:Cation:proton antiporter n=1 Tax=Mangrovibacillus cuniculi TaxID=2593652 RepID=A0A7S8CDT6_9BACI|nr:cation:proton antiporter [Mangrovibacillus cuniculi]QPC48138.1 cation:proton antiporter [Mangrovibacillus cuniculi]